MIPSPIQRALSTMKAHDVAHLVMGGQACVLYGAAEFSRDADLAILAEPANLRRLRDALDALNASVIAVPPLEQSYLDRGHAVHFRCGGAELSGLRIDVMARMRGVDAFPALWDRRTVVQPEVDAHGIVELDVLALPDLVAAKKTQRDKDWPMIRRLVEANYFEFRDDLTPERVQFWLNELRTPELLIEVVSRFRDDAAVRAEARIAVSVAKAPTTGGRSATVDAVRIALDEEQRLEQAADRAYWAPLRAELAQLRRSARQ